MRNGIVLAKTEREAHLPRLRARSVLTWFLAAKTQATERDDTESVYVQK
jgi:hypothetical protein